MRARLISRVLPALLCAPAIFAGASLSAGAAHAGGGCPSGAGIRAAVCGDAGRVEILLMPGDLALLDAGPAGAVSVTGAYTGAGVRDSGDGPKPVGVFIARGERISLELARMDGLLVAGADGRARISTVSDARIGAEAFDLRDLAGRVAFAKAAEAAGASALQSHLLIRDGALDLREVEGAPTARRRILFQAASGDLAIWESGGARTLYAAAVELQAAHAPVMALNLDMGGHDFCEEARDGHPRSCGIVGRGEQMAKLSNLVRLVPAP
ncbi:hypothetical protein ACQ5SO_00500 [Rhodovulum sp. DZ06]|uniref:hypothetical protein n=1 Tax=Rhodovulum sp. DZ06 TaxID=3425126 RepID=UPI003D3475DC